MNFPMSEAFTRIFPDLARMTLPQGTIDVEQVIPSNDVQLIGTKSKVLIHSDLHPEIVQLLLQTMKEVHGGADLFHRSGEYPNGSDSEYTVAPTAIDFYKNGPSFMQRHLPLWLSVHVQRAIAVLVTGIAIGLPLLHFVPQSFNWMTRRRLFYWYAQLKALEAVVQLKYQPQTFDQQTSRDRAHRGRRQQNPLSAEILGPGVYFTQSHRHCSAKDCISLTLFRTNGRLTEPCRLWADFVAEVGDDGPWRLA